MLVVVPLTIGGPKGQVGAAARRVSMRRLELRWTAKYGLAAGVRIGLVGCMADGLTITDFLLDNGVDLRATVTWNPAAPGSAAQADMTGDRPGGGTWEERNGGVAFLHLVRAGAALRFETWGTDTNGDYSAAAIDIFTLPIDLTQPFPASLANAQVPSPHGRWTYLLRPLPGNPYGFLLNAGSSASLPPTAPSGLRIS